MTIKESLGGDGGVVPGGVCDGVEYFETEKRRGSRMREKNARGVLTDCSIGA